MNPVKIDHTDSILPTESLNGRVNIIDIPNDVVFAMKEKIIPPKLLEKISLKK